MTRNWRLKVDREKELKIVNLYKKGYSMHKVAMMLGVTSATVLHYVKSCTSKEERRQEE